MILTECGHTFCQACISEFTQENTIVCPIDEVFSYKSIIDNQVISQIEIPKQEFIPTCEQHQGKQIIFYNPQLQTFSCQQCFNEESNAIPEMNGLHFISYDKLKPKILERLTQRIEAKRKRDHQQLRKDICIYIIQQLKKCYVLITNMHMNEQIRLLKEQTKKQLEKVNEILEKEAEKEAIKMLAEQNQKIIETSKDQMNECQKFMDKFRVYLEKDQKQ
ncbi:hypothetical protein FGO68_gene311 [Halteria grandinella]|uniref:RING-type domain-containing protein n=1 Tax=Halteria grandinella TaxID=5974 RepID=A0A8J8P0X5_HALGN|nr:hypothetical protein FGO68_gene311 [Halteria grandinella]